jgi:hypothetical protein
VVKNPRHLPRLSIVFAEQEETMFSGMYRRDFLAAMGLSAGAALAASAGQSAQTSTGDADRARRVVIVSGRSPRRP